jgi:hypothetical protein
VRETGFFQPADGLQLFELFLAERLERLEGAWCERIVESIAALWCARGLCGGDVRKLSLSRGRWADRPSARDPR